MVQASLGRGAQSRLRPFLSKDRGRTVQPNPHSLSTVGPDHLAYYALLGRVAALALYHREPLDASLSTAFVKAAFGYAVTFEVCSHRSDQVRL